MGINNLMPFIRSACTAGLLHQNHRGKVYAVDMSCLIYKGIYHGNYIDYIRKYMNCFKKLASRVILVFDGKPPKAKCAEVTSRINHRMKHRLIAADLFERANAATSAEDKKKLLNEAEKMAMRSRGMTQEVIDDIKTTFGSLENFEVVQSPGESDAQLAYLALNGIADLVITDDTDLVVYGCPNIVFKLRPGGQGVFYDVKKLALSFEWPVFRWMCIMAGCDYLKGGLKGLGIIKAKRFLEDINPHPPYDEDCLRSVLKRFPGITDDLIDRFMQAEKTFMQASVYDPRDKSVKPLFVT